MQTKSKKAINIVIIVVFSLLVLFTFVSRTVYNRNLPRVTSNRITSGFVPLEIETVAELYYENELVIKSGGSWKIGEVFVEDGDEVKRGDIICSFDTRALEIERMSIELEILMYNNTLTAMDERRLWTNAERRQHQRDREQIVAALELAEARLEYNLSMEPPRTTLTAPAAGIISGLSIKPDDMLWPGAEILTLTPDEKPLLKFTLPPVEGEAFSSGTPVNAVIEVVHHEDGEDVVFERLHAQGKIVTGSLQNGQWECIAQLNDFAGQVVPGQEVPIKMTQRGVRQDFIVPLDCIFDKSGGQKVIYVIESRPGLFGEESYLWEASVVIIFDNGEYASIAGSDFSTHTRIASDLTHWAGHGDTVWVRDEKR